MTDPADYSVLDTERVYRGRVVTLRRDTIRMSDGAGAVREVVEHLGAVAVVALDEKRNVIVVNQYRHPVGRRLDELPAGLLDVDGESALNAAQRELAEEAGVTAAHWHVLVDLHTSPGFSTEAVRVYLARDLTPIADRDRFVAEHEERTMTVDHVPLADAVTRALDGRITNAIAVAGILAAEHGQRTGWTALRPADSPWPGRPGR